MCTCTRRVEQLELFHSSSLIAIFAKLIQFNFCPFHPLHFLSDNTPPSLVLLQNPYIICYGILLFSEMNNLKNEII